MRTFCTSNGRWPSRSSATPAAAAAVLTLVVCSSVGLQRMPYNELTARSRHFADAGFDRAATPGRRITKLTCPAQRSQILFRTRSQLDLTIGLRLLTMLKATFWTPNDRRRFLCEISIMENGLPFATRSAAAIQNLEKRL
jgi:hypothetical protein